MRALLFAIILSSTSVIGQTQCEELKKINKDWKENPAIDVAVRLINQVETARSDCQKDLLNGVMNLASYYQSHGKLDSSLFYIKKAIIIANSINDSASLVRVHQKSGSIYYSDAKMNDAAQQYELAMSFVDQNEIKNKPIIGNIAYGLSISYNRLGAYDKALKNSLITIQEDYNTNKKTLHQRYNTHAWLLMKIGTYHEALSSNQKAMDYMEVASDSSALLSCWATRGQIFLLKGDLDSSEYYHTQVLKNEPWKGNEASVAVTLADLGDVYARGEQFERARDTLEKAIDLFETSTGNIYLTAHQSLAGVYYELGEYSLAIHHLNKPWPHFLKDNHFAGLQRGANIYARSYLQLGLKDSALYYLNIAWRMKDSLFALERSKSIAALEVDFDTKLKETTIGHQKSQLDQNEKIIKITKERNKAKDEQLTIVWVALLIAVLFLAAILLLYRSSRKKSILLAKRDAEKAILLKEIHHRVKNNLSVISSLLNLQSGSINDETALNALNEGRNRVKSIALIHQKLYQTDDLAEIDVQEYIGDLSKQLKFAFGHPKCQIELKQLPFNHTIDIDTAVPLGLMLNELFTNSFKHAGVIDLKIKAELRSDLKQGYTLTFKDNGKGFPKDFNPNKITSLGISLLQMLSKQLRGSCHFESENGAVVTIHFQPTEIRKSVV